MLEKSGKSDSKNEIATVVGKIAAYYAKAFATHEELSTALYWIEKASEFEETPLLLYSKAKVLIKLGRKQEALEIIRKQAKEEKNKENRFISVVRYPNVNFTQALKDIEDGTF